MEPDGWLWCLGIWQAAEGASKGDARAMNRARKPIRIVPKGWGREVWIVNGDLYCGKILEIRKGKRCSLHFHKIKNESFYLRTDASRSGSRSHLRPRPSKSSNSSPANAWTFRRDWCIRWKRWRTPNCS